MHAALASQTADAMLCAGRAASPVTASVAAPPLAANSVGVSSSLAGNGSGETQSAYSSLLGNNNCLSDLASSATPTNANRTSLTTAPNTTTFDYLYEFSETRKVLEDFFKNANNDDDKKIVDCFNESDTGSYVSGHRGGGGGEGSGDGSPKNRSSTSQENLHEIEEKNADNYIGQRLAKLPPTEANNKDYSSTYQTQVSPRSKYTGISYVNHQHVRSQ